MDAQSVGPAGSPIGPSLPAPSCLPSPFPTLPPTAPQDESLPDFKDVIRFEPRELAKYFEVGRAHCMRAGAGSAARVQPQRLGPGVPFLKPTFPNPNPNPIPTLSSTPPSFSSPLPQSGEHVKVVHGQHEGETGMVVRVETPVAYVFTDSSHQVGAVPFALWPRDSLWPRGSTPRP